MRRISQIVLFEICLLFWALTSSSADPLKDARHSLAERAFANPALAISQAPRPIQEIPGLARAAAWESFQDRVSPGTSLHALFEPRTGRPAVIEMSLPWIPGAGNALSAHAIPSYGQQSVLAVLERLGREFVVENEDLLGVSEPDLILNKTASQGTRPLAVEGKAEYLLWHLVFDWAPHGTRVEGARLVFRISHGNLIQIEMQNIADREAVPPGPGRVGKEQARAVLEQHAEGILDGDGIGSPALRVLPAATELVPAKSSGHDRAPGKGLAYRAAWVFSFEQEGEPWEAAVDSQTGELLYLTSTALEAYASGKVRTNGHPTEEVTVPFPYVDYKQNPVEYAGPDGFIYWLNSSTSHLAGRTAVISDLCGPIDVTSPGPDLDFGGSNSNVNCNSSGGGTGNTAAARTSYYHVTQGKRFVQGYLPGMSWLDTPLLLKTNLNAKCLAEYIRGTGTPTNPERLEFHRSASGCRNTGEIESHILHELGHGVDYNDGTSPGTDGAETEAYGDIVAFLVTRDSCIGRGLDNGVSPPLCGFSSKRDYTCTQCDGFRDVSWATHSPPVPHTPATNLSCAAAEKPTYVGPCGLQPHCETAPATEAVWDLVYELTARGYSDNDAWSKVSELFLGSRPSAGSMFTCAYATTSRQGGAAAGSLYYTLRAADDCDGDPTDGTPNAEAIFAALDRHQIAVGSASDPMNQNDPCDRRPIANFTYSCTGRTCTFNGSTSTDDFGVTSWTWSFGDGTAPITENDPVIIHTFATSNRYWVTLSVRDTLNQPSSDTVQNVLADDLPVVRFNFTCNGLSCSFDASGSTDDNPPLSFLWSWGDNTPNTGYAATATHAFAAPGSYSVTVTVTDSLGGQSTLSKLVAVTNEATPNPARYFALPPCRLLDTRSGVILTSASPRLVQVTGVCGIPASARAVSFNVTVVSPTGSGRLNFYPGNQSAVTATTINFAPATSPRANNAILRLATNGTGVLGVYPTVFASPGQVHLILDVQGYYSEDIAPAPTAQGPLGFQNVTTCRIADTRPAAPLAAGSTRTFSVQGVCGIPAGAPAASLNLTAAQASGGGGFLTLFASNSAPPSVSTINFNNGTAALANGARTNLAPTPPDLAAQFAGPAGATVHAIVDAHGYFKAGAPLSYRPFTACRALDTRVAGSGAPALVSGTTRSFQIRGNCGIPSRARAVFANVVVVTPTAAGHLTVFPSGTTQPSVPNLNFDANEPVLGNGMIVPLSTAADDLSINLFAPPAGSAHVIVDVFGWFDDPLPTASFTYSCSNRTCTFNASGSSDNVGISQYSWNFGDGPAPGSGATASHTYVASNYYDVTLTVTDTAGQTASQTQRILAHLPPTPCFTYACTGLNCSFDARCSQDDLNSITSYTWSFGDGGTASGVWLPTHSYAAAGTYPVTLTVTDSGGLTASQTQQVPVTGPVVMGEAGLVSLNRNQATVNLSRSYTNPVVFAQPLSWEGGWDPAAVVRVFDVQSNRFSLVIDSLGVPPNANFVWETVSWMVLEAGSWEPEGLTGVRMEVGKITSAATIGARVNPNTWSRVNFAGNFGQTPVILTQTQTRNDLNWVKTRQKSPSATGVDLAMEPYAAETRTHGSETIGWLAVKPSIGLWSGRNFSADRLTGSFGATDQWSSVGFGSFCAVWSYPYFLASLSSTNELHGHLRYKGLVKTTCQTRVDLMVQEDATLTPYTDHVLEDVDRFAVDSGSGLLRGVRLAP